MFIDKDDLQLILAGGEKAVEHLNKILFKVAQRAVEDTLRSLPAIINNLTMQAATIQKLGEDFYKSNSEFTKHKDLVGQTIELIEAENPGKTFEDVLKLAVPEIQRKINLKESISSTGNAKPTLASIDSKLGDL